MDLPPKVSPSHKSPLFTTDKTNLKYDSILLSALGIFIFLACAFIFGTEGMVFYTILSLFYLISGLTGFIGIKKKSNSCLFIFKTLNYFLIAANLCFVLLGCFFFVYSMGLYMDCNGSNSQDKCATETMAAIFIEILCIVEVTVSCSAIAVILVVNKHFKFYTDDLMALHYKKHLG